MKYFEIPNLMAAKYYDAARLEFDGDKTDLRLHSEERFSWGSETEKEYNKACKAIDNINYKGKGWELYAWYDVSGFTYWREKQQEPNYIQITIAFDKEVIDTRTLVSIKNAHEKAIERAKAIENKHSHLSYYA